jgi:hypothetical protein
VNVPCGGRPVPPSRRSEAPARFASPHTSRSPENRRPDDPAADSTGHHRRRTGSSSGRSDRSEHVRSSELWLTCRAARHTDDIVWTPRDIHRAQLGGTSPSRKPGTRLRVALSAVPTPDETVWSLRASDIYQGSETEPLPRTERAGSSHVARQRVPKKTTVG